jgi:Zn-dependent protease with chaperone function
MQFLLLLFLMLPCLPDHWTQVAWIPSVESSSVLTWLGIALAVLFAAIIARGVRSRLLGRPEERELWLRRYGRFRLLHTFGLFGIYLVALYFFGWGWTVQSFFSRNDQLLPGAELVILAPFFVGLVASWACFYDAERVIHETSPRRSRGERDWNRFTYVVFHLRQYLALAFLPVLLYIIEKNVWRLVPETSTAIYSGVGILATLGLFLLLPLALRVVLGLRPLPPGPMRDRLMMAAERLRFRFGNILLWGTRGGVANAMVVGILPRVRYVIFTDRLLDEMAPEEVEAVFGHEVGHVKHHHMLYYLVFLFLSFAVVWALASFALGQVLDWLPAYRDTLKDSIGEQWVIVPLLMTLAVYIFAVFGFLSRRCERQADIFGCRAVSCANPRCEGHTSEILPAAEGKGLCPTGIGIFISALEKVAVLNGISRDRPGWLQSWQHSTIARRIDFLERMRADLSLESHFQRRVALVKWLLFLALIGLSILTVVLVEWETLLKMG